MGGSLLRIVSVEMTGVGGRVGGEEADPFGMTSKGVFGSGEVGWFRERCVRFREVGWFREKVCSVQGGGGMVQGSVRSVGRSS